MAEDKDNKEKKDSINKEIDSLNTEKVKYKNMNKKLEEALVNLKKTKNYLDTAYIELEKNYSTKSTMAAKKKMMLQNKINTINKLIKNLNETILPESKRQITSINAKVTDKNDEIKKLNKK